MERNIIGLEENETPDETIIRCANNLVEAVLAAGYSLEETSDCSGFTVRFYSHRKGEIFIQNILSGWAVAGKTPFDISYLSD